jgi:hypothetical protein
VSEPVWSFAKLFDLAEWVTPNRGGGWKKSRGPGRMFDYRNIDLLMETLADPDEPITKDERAILLEIVRDYDKLLTIDSAV